MKQRLLKFLLIPLLFGLIIGAASAQSTTVSGTITDSDSLNWIGAKVQFSLVNPYGPRTQITLNGTPLTAAQLNVNVVTDNSGSFSTSLLSNSSLQPTNTTWNIQVCPQASVPCQNIPTQIISGTTQSLTTVINANITAPRFAAGYYALGYGDVEVQPTPNPGATYFNITTPAMRVWTGVAWISSLTPSTGVTSFNSRTGAVSPSSGDYTAAMVTNALDLSTTNNQTINGNITIAVGKSLNTPIIRDNAGNAAATLATGIFTFSNTIKVPSVTINGGQAMSNPPDFTWNAGSVNVNSVGSTGSFTFIPKYPITLTQMDWSINTVGVGCTTFGQVQILASGSLQTGLTGIVSNGSFQGSNSGTVNIAAGTQMVIRVNQAPAGCTTTPGTSNFITVHYAMQ